MTLQIAPAVVEYAGTSGYLFRKGEASVLMQIKAEQNENSLTKYFEKHHSMREILDPSWLAFMCVLFSAAHNRLQLCSGQHELHLLSQHGRRGLLLDQVVSSINLQLGFQVRRWVQVFTIFSCASGLRREQKRRRQRVREQSGRKLNNRSEKLNGSKLGFGCKRPQNSQIKQEILYYC